MFLLKKYVVANMKGHDKKEFNRFVKSVKKTHKDFSVSFIEIDANRFDPEYYLYLEDEGCDIEPEIEVACLLKCGNKQFENTPSLEWITSNTNEAILEISDYVKDSLNKQEYCDAKKFKEDYYYNQMFSF